MPAAIARLLPFLLVLLAIYGAAWLVTQGQDGRLRHVSPTTRVFLAFVILVAVVVFISRVLLN